MTPTSTQGKMLQRVSPSDSCSESAWAKKIGKAIRFGGRVFRDGQDGPSKSNRKCSTGRQRVQGDISSEENGFLLRHPDETEDLNGAGDESDDA